MRHLSSEAVVQHLHISTPSYAVTFISYGGLKPTNLCKTCMQRKYLFMNVMIPETNVLDRSGVSAFRWARTSSSELVCWKKLPAAAGSGFDENALTRPYSKSKTISLKRPKKKAGWVIFFCGFIIMSDPYPLPIWVVVKIYWFIKLSTTKTRAECVICSSGFPGGRL